MITALICIVNQNLIHQNIPVVNAIYDENSEMVDGRIVLRKILEKF